jgi:hypothetical protein
MFVASSGPTSDESSPWTTLGVDGDIQDATMTCQHGLTRGQELNTTICNQPNPTDV